MYYNNFIIREYEYYDSFVEKHYGNYYCNFVFFKSLFRRLSLKHLIYVSHIRISSIEHLRFKIFLSERFVSRSLIISVLKIKMSLHANNGYGKIDSSTTVTLCLKTKSAPLRNPTCLKKKRNNID